MESRNLPLRGRGEVVSFDSEQMLLLAWCHTPECCFGILVAEVLMDGEVLVCCRGWNKCKNSRRSEPRDSASKGRAVWALVLPPH